MLDSKSQLHTLVIPSVNGLKLPFALEQDAVQLTSGVWPSNMVMRKYFAAVLSRH